MQRKLQIMQYTYKEKDKLLRYMCEHCTPEAMVQLDVNALLAAGIAKQQLPALLSYFTRIGLISEPGYRHSAPLFSTIVYTEAFDLFNRGGFTVQEQLLEQEVEKLLLEIEALKPTLGDKVVKLLSIAGSISALLKPF